jgi:hypothetical protein
VVTQFMMSNERLRHVERLLIRIVAASGPQFVPEAEAVFLRASLWATNRAFGTCPFQELFVRRPSKCWISFATIHCDRGWEYRERCVSLSIRRKGGAPHQ